MAFVLGLGCFCLTSPRSAAVTLGMAGIGLFVVTIFPMLFWNMQHDWVSFRFQSERVPRTVQCAECRSRL